MGKIISLFNHKGGVGKTTFTHNLAFTLANQNKNVLLIDVDPQMNLTSAVLGFSDKVEYADGVESEWTKARRTYTNINDYLTAKLEDKQLPLNLYHYIDKQEDLVRLRGRVSLLCGDIQLFNIESYLYNVVTKKTNIRDQSVYKVEKSIREMALDYDFVIIDTSPSASSILNGIMIMMSDYFISPVFPTFFSLQAIDNLFEVMQNWINLLVDYKQTPNNNGLSFQPKFLGIVINMAKRFEKDTEKVTIYAQNWRGKLNASITRFHQSVIDTKRTISREDFKRIFNEREPFIIEELCDFTGQLRNVAEVAGVPIINLTNEIVREAVSKIGCSPFTVTKVRATDDNHYQTVFKSVCDSYNHIANGLLKL